MIGPFKELSLKSVIVATDSEVKMIRGWEMDVTFVTDRLLIVKMAWSISTKAFWFTESWYDRSEMFATDAEKA